MKQQLECIDTLLLDDPAGFLSAGPALQASKSRPRVLIIPNSASWIIGQMAVHIMNRFGSQYEFWFMTDKMIKLRPDLVRTLAPALDFIFPLTDTPFDLIQKAIYPLELPSLFWIHHITSWAEPMRQAIAKSNELIVCTPEWKDAVTSHCAPDAPVTVVLHGVDLRVFKRVPSQRRRLGIPEQAFVAGFVGSKTSNYDEGRKGLDVLMAAVIRLRQRVPRLHVAFLGLGWDAEVERLRNEGISANYVGFMPQTKLPDFYSSIDAYVLTSRVEGGPCTVLEAMACETPVVATRVGLVPRTIRDGENGYSVPIGDTDSLADYLGELASSPGLAKRIGIAGRGTVDPYLSWERVLGSLEQPLARAASLSRRSVETSPFGSRDTASALHRAVHTADGILWALMSWAQRLVTFKVAFEMAKACLEEHNALDVLRAFGLVARLRFRPKLAWRRA